MTLKWKEMNPRRLFSGSGKFSFRGKLAMRVRSADILHQLRIPSDMHGVLENNSWLF